MGKSWFYSLKTDRNPQYVKSSGDCRKSDADSGTAAQWDLFLTASFFARWSHARSFARINYGRDFFFGRK